MAKKRSATTRALQNTQKIDAPYGIREGFWLYVLLGLMAIFSAYILSLHLNGFAYLLNVQTIIVGVALFLAPLLALIFCVLFIYKYVRGYKISLIPKLVTLILASGLSLILLIAAPASSSCIPTTTSNCSLVFPFILAALSYSHTIEITIVSVFLVAGIIALLLEEKKST